MLVVDRCSTVRGGEGGGRLVADAGRVLCELDGFLLLALVTLGVTFLIATPLVAPSVVEPKRADMSAVELLLLLLPLLMFAANFFEAGRAMYDAAASLADGIIVTPSRTCRPGKDETNNGT
jgi:hypothetical protein